MGKRETERLERIRANEDRLDSCLTALGLLRAACKVWRSCRGDLRELEAYYTGPDWKEDYEADEKGLLPADLKRGVLSQDAVGDLLDAAAELPDELRELLGEEER